MKSSRFSSSPQATRSRARSLVLVNKISRGFNRGAAGMVLRGSAAVLTAIVLYGFNPPTHAATDTWVGIDTAGTPTTDWVNADNWAADLAPASGDSLVFTGSNGQSTNILTDSLTSSTFLLDGITFNFGAPAYTLTGNPFELGGPIINLSATTQTVENAITLSGTETFSTNASGGNITVGGVITDSGSGYGITVAGGGTLTLNGTATNTYAGATTLIGGNLTLNFSNMATPTNLIGASSVLTIGGGTVQIVGQAGVATSQTFNGTTLTPGEAVISAAPASGTTLPTVSLGALSGLQTPGVAIEFVGPATIGANSVAVPATATIMTTSSGTGVFGAFYNGNNATGNIVIAPATVGLYDWASTDTTGGVAGTSPYTIIGGSQVTNFYQSTGITTTSAAYDFSAAGTNTIGNAAGSPLVRFNAAVTGTINTTATTAQDIYGFLITPNVGANNEYLSGSGLEFGRYTDDVQVFGTIWQNNTKGFFNVTLSLNGGREGGQNNGLIQNGPGTVVYSAANFYEASTYLNGGFSVVDADSGFGNVADAGTTPADALGETELYLNGGTAVGNATFTMDNAGANKRPITLEGFGGGLAATAGNTMTIDGTISSLNSSNGPLVIGIPASTANSGSNGLLPGTGAGTANTTGTFATGTVVLTAPNSYYGGTVLDSGTLNINGINALGGADYGGITFNGGALQYSTGFSGNGSGDLTSIGTAGVTIASGGGTIDTNGNVITYAGGIGNGGSGALTVKSSASGGSLTVDGNNKFGGITLTSGKLIFAGANNFGTGGVTVTSGTMTLDGANVYSGATTVSGGELALNQGSSLPNTAITVSSQAILLASPSGNGNISIGTTSATLTLNGGAILSLTALDADSLDTLTLNATGAGTGTVLKVGGPSSLSTLDFDLGSNGSDELIINDGVTTFGADGGKIGVSDLDNAPPQSSYTLISDPNGGLASGTGLGAHFELANTTIVADGTTYHLSLANSTTTAEIVTLTAVSDSFYFTGAASSSWNNVGGNFITTHNSGVAQTGSLSNISNVFLTADAASNFATETVDGNTTINSLSFTGTDSSVGNTPAATTGITLNSGTATTPLVLAAANPLSDANGNTYAIGVGLVVQPGSAAHTINTNIGLGASQSWDVNNSPSNPLTMNGVISNATGTTLDVLTKTGTGTLILENANTYNGGTTVSGGTLMLGATGSIITATASLTVTGSGTFDLGGNSISVSTLSDGGVSTGILTTSTGSAVLTFANTIADSFGGSITDNNAVNGASLSINLAGSATVTLSGDNTYTGMTTLNSGNLTVAANSALGSGSSPNGGLTINGATSTAYFTSANPTIASLNGVSTSTIVLGNASGASATNLTVGGGGQTATFNGVISDLSGVNINAIGSLTVGSGVLTLTGSNTFTGTTAVLNGGTLVLGNSGALQYSIVNYNGQGGTLSFGSLTAATFGSLEGSETLPLTNSSSGVVALTIDDGTNKTYSGALIGGGALNVTGGTQILSGANDFTGATTISGGTLTLSGGTLGTAVTPTGAITDSSAIFNINGASVYAASLTSNNTGGAAMTMTSGTLNLGTGALEVNDNNGADGSYFSLTGGTVTAGSMTIGRDGLNYGAAFVLAGSAVDGVYVNGGILNISGALGIGTVGGAHLNNSTANMRMDSGSITVAGVTDIADYANSRTSILDINGGTFTDQDTSGIGINLGGGAEVGGGSYDELLVRGTGLLITPAITLGLSGQTNGENEFLAIGGTTEVGSGGIVPTAGTNVYDFVVLGNATVATTPTIVATASWTSPLNMTLSNSGTAGGSAAPIFAPMAGTDMTLSGVLSGSGGLTLNGSGGILTLNSTGNSYSGLTTILSGTLNINSEYALGGADYSGITINGGTLQYASTLLNAVTDLTGTAPFTIGANGATIDTNGNNISYANPIGNGGAGGLTVVDSVAASGSTGGSLTLQAPVAYTGPTNINSGGKLVLSTTGTFGNMTISVGNTGTFGVKPNSGNMLIGTTNASLALGAGASFTMADGTVGTLTISGSTGGTTLGLYGTTASPDNLTFDLGTTGADQLIIDNGGVAFAAANPQSDIFLDSLGGAAPPTLTGIPILTASNASLSLSDFVLESPLITFNGSVYQASLSVSGTELMLNLVQGAPSTYYFTGTDSSSWSNVSNFSADPAGAFPQSTGSLSNLSDVFLTSANPKAGNFALETLDANYTINALSFTGSGTGAGSTSITLASSSGTTAYTVTLAAGQTFADANGNNYPIGTGLVVQPGSAAQTISANIDLGASQTWEINNSASNPLTVTSVIADAPSTSHDALTITGSGTLILTNANTYDGGTTVSGGRLMLGTGGALSSTGILTVNGGTFDLGGNNQSVTGLSDGGVSTGVITSSTGAAATLTVNNAIAETFSGTITDSNNAATTANDTETNGVSLALYLAGPANFTLSGSNSFIGGITLAAGNLTVSNNYGLGVAVTGTLSPNTGLTFNNTNTSNVYLTSANPQVASINNGPLATGSANIILGNATAGTATTLFLGAGGSAQSFVGDTFTGTISDQTASNAAAIGNLVIVDGGFVQLNGADTFTGTTIISGSNPLTTFASELQLGNAAALENSTLIYNNQGGVLSFGSLTAATLGGLTGSEALSLANTSSAAVTLSIGNNNVSSVYVGSLNGAGGLTKVGSGTFQTGSGTQGGATYTGATTVVGGTLIIGGNSNLIGAVDLTGAPAAAGGVGPANALIVQDNAVITAPSELFLSSNDGGAATDYAGASTLTVTGTASVTAPSFSIGHTSRVESGAGVTISGSGSLIINGNFALLATEGSTASTTTINLNGGTLLADSFTLGQGSEPATQLVNMYFNGGVLETGASDNPPTTDFLPILSGLTANVMAGGAIINTNGFNITIAQPLVSGTTNDGGLTKLGGGILTLAGTTTYTGPTNIKGGELALANINSIEDTSGITFTGSGGALQYTSANTKDYSAKILNSTAAITIDTNGQQITYASSIAGSNAGGLTVENSTPNTGGLTLTSANAYTGATTVQSGADLILGSGGSTPTGSAVSVSGSIQALLGNGGIGGSLSLGAGSTLSLVDGSIGTLTIGGGMTIGGTSAATIDLELDTNAGTNDSITVSGGPLAFGAGGGVINVSEIAGDGTSAPGASAYKLFTDAAGFGTDNFTLGQASLLIGTQNYALSLTTTGTTEILNLTAASLNFYWTGKSSSSFNNIANFAQTIAGTSAQLNNLSGASDIFLTATSSQVNHLPATLDGNYTINSLSFTGAGTGGTNAIVLSSGTATAPLTIAATAQFADASGTTYNVGTGIVVQPGAGAATISSPIELGNSQTWEINNSSSNPLTVSGVVEDGTSSSLDSLTKSGPGNLILNAVETYNGGTIVTGGTLALGPSGTLNSTAGLTVSGTGTFDLAGHTQTVSSLSDGGVATGVITTSTGAATLAINNTSQSTFSGTITDANALNGSSLALLLEGNSNVTLSGSNSYTGGTTLNNGNLTVAANYALGSAVTTNTNAGLTMNAAFSGTENAFFTSANPNIAALNSGTNGSAVVVLGNSTNNTPTTLNVGASGLASVFNGNIINSGTAVGTAAIGNLVVAGGSLTLNGSDTFSGTTVVAAGTLILGNTNALTGSIVNYNNQGGVLSFGSLNGATIGGLEGGEGIALSNTTGAAITLTIQNLNSATNYSGALSGSGSLVITSSSASQTFSGVNTYAGTTTIGVTTSGTTIIASTGAIGTAAAPSGALTQTLGSILNVAGGAIYASSITNNSGAIINVSSGAILTATGALAINANNGSTAPGLLYITSGVVTANSVTVGRDGLNNASTLPLAGGTSDGIYMTGGTLNIATTLGVGTPTNANSSVNFRMDGGTVTVGGIATITDHSGSRSSIMDLNGGTFTDEDTSGVGLQIGGNADTNGLLLAELLVRNTAVLNTPAITLNGGAQTSGTDAFFDLGGTTNIGSGGIVSGTGGATVLVEIGNGSVSVAPTITASASWSSSVPMLLSNDAASVAPTFVTASGSNITLSGALTGVGAGLNAKGTGILTLSGDDTYTGVTAVTGTGGRLIISGSVVGTAAVTVAPGANLEVDGLLTSTAAAAISGRLSGIGSFDGATIASSGTIAAGFSTGSTSAGTLNSTGNVAFSSTLGTLSIRLGVTTGASGDNDQLSLTNGATLTLNDTTLRLSLGAAEATAGFDSLYVIVNGGAGATGSGTDVFGNAPLSGDSITVNGQVFDVFYAVSATNPSAVGNDIDVELVSVPEPGAWAEIVAGVLVLCIWQRSRRRDRRNA